MSSEIKPKGRLLQGPVTTTLPSGDLSISKVMLCDLRQFFGMDLASIIKYFPSASRVTLHVDGIRAESATVIGKSEIEEEIEERKALARLLNKYQPMTSTPENTISASLTLGPQSPSVETLETLLTTQCVDCGTEENITFEACPYAADIEGDYTPLWLCRHCSGHRADEI